MRQRQFSSMLNCELNRSVEFKVGASGKIECSENMFHSALHLKYPNGHLIKAWHYSSIAVNWLYCLDGCDGLKTKPLPGRPSKLSGKMMQWVYETVYACDGVKRTRWRRSPSLSSRLAV